MLTHVFKIGTNPFFQISGFSNGRKRCQISGTVDGINYASVFHMGSKHGLRPKICFFTKWVQNRDLELSTGASGSKLWCASFLSWTCSGKNIDSVYILALTCFIVENWPQIICLYHDLVPDASFGRDNGIQHRIARRNQWNRFQINESI